MRAERLAGPAFQLAGEGQAGKASRGVELGQQRTDIFIGIVSQMALGMIAVLAGAVLLMYKQPRHAEKRRGENRDQAQGDDHS
jgi:hypothetical protein